MCIRDSLNTNLIDGYLSAIDGFLYDEETQEEHSNTQKAVSYTHL